MRVRPMTVRPLDGQQHGERLDGWRLREQRAQHLAQLLHRHARLVGREDEQRLGVLAVCASGRCRLPR